MTLWFILFISLILLDFSLIIYPKIIRMCKAGKTDKDWPHVFQIIERRRLGGKSYFIVERWRDGDWGIVGRYFGRTGEVWYFNIASDSTIGTFDENEWDTKEEAQEIANAYCEYHKSITFREIVGKFTVE